MKFQYDENLAQYFLKINKTLDTSLNYKIVNQAIVLK